MTDAGFAVSTVRPGDPGWDAHVGLFADYRAHYGQDRDPQHCDLWLRQQLDAGRYLCYLAHGGPDGSFLALVEDRGETTRAVAVFV